MSPGSKSVAAVAGDIRLPCETFNPLAMAQAQLPNGKACRISCLYRQLLPQE